MQQIINEIFWLFIYIESCWWLVLLLCEFLQKITESQSNYCRASMETPLNNTQSQGWHHCAYKTHEKKQKTVHKVLNSLRSVYENVTFKNRCYCTGLSALSHHSQVESRFHHTSVWYRSDMSCTMTTITRFIANMDTPIKKTNII